MTISEWPQWNAVTEAKYSSLQKYNVFGENFTDLEKPHIQHKLIFTRKLDAQG